MKLIIFGSMGGTGRQVVTQALEQGHDVIAFARNPESLDQKHEKLQVIKGNVLDYASIERAIQGQDAVLCTLGLSPMDKSNLRAKGTKNIIRAIERHVPAPPGIANATSAPVGALRRLRLPLMWDVIS